MNKRMEILKIVLCYALFGCIWIYFSDSVLSGFVRDPAIMTEIAIFKGLAFIACTSLLLFFLISRLHKKIKKSTNALHKSERHLQTLVQTIPDLIWLKDKEGVFLSCNLQFELLLGAKQADIIGKTDYDFVDRDLADFFLEHDRKAIAAGKPTSNEEWVTFAGDGHRALLETIKTPMYDGNGVLIGVLGIGRDITHREQMERELRASEEKFRSLAESSPDYIMRYDLGCRRTYLNPAALAVNGLAEADIIGKTHRESGVASDLSTILEEKITEVIKTTRPSQTEFTWESMGGQVYLDLRLTPEFDAENKVHSVLGVARDITDRKQAEERLRELEEQFRLTFYTSPDAININEMDGTYLEINQGFTQLTGYTREEVLGVTSADIKIWDIPEDRQRLIDGLQRDGYVKNLESRFLMKDGSHKIALLSATILPLKGTPHILSISRDITDLRRTEEENLVLERQLQQAQKMESVGRLAGGVAHDFNNMLGVILGHTELAMEELKPDQPILANLQQIKLAADRSTSITRQLLAFARKQIVSPKVIDLNATVAETVKMLLRLIGEDIELAWIPGAQLWPIKIDPSQIDQILANLCVNARDAIAGVGKITVETANCEIDEEYCSVHAGFISGQYVKVAVSDNGSGMDKETMLHIFEPFFTTKGVSEGTGLGLATVYGVVKQNNGFVNVYSEQGRGTTFSIYLPRHVGPASLEQDKAAEVPPLRGDETILLVEDEPTILDMTTTMLQRLDYNVLAAGTPNAAMHLADEHAGEIHLLLTDVIMPEMNGRILSEKLMVRRPGLKCLFMSGYTANVISHQGVLDDGVSFLQKPFTKRELAAKIRQALTHG